MIYSIYIKRSFDFGASIMGLVLFSWLFVSISLVTWMMDGTPLFFTQKRIGRNNKPFMVWKFRTLTTHESKPLHERRFAWGDFLRRTNLDELPQLWNIVKGEMSFIGPRPLPVEYLLLMSEKQRIRHTVLPGITGWAQVNGRHTIPWAQKFELDVYYVNHISFGTDILILFKTIVLLLSFKKDQSLTEEKFKGN